MADNRKPTGKRRGPARQSPAVIRAKGDPGKRNPSKREIEEPPDDGLDDELLADLGDGVEPGAVEAEPPGAPGDRITAVEPPAFITDAARAIWNELAPRLQQQNILHLLDAWAFARYCMNFAQWIKLNEQIAVDGETYKAATAHGTFIKGHPAFMMADRLHRALVHSEADFGLNPADRQRLFLVRLNAGAGGEDLFTPHKKVGKAAAAQPGKQPRNPVGWAVH